MRIQRALPPGLLSALLLASSACAGLFPTDVDGQERAFCITQNGGESLLCCPSPGLGCQAVEAAQ